MPTNINTFFNDQLYFFTFYPGFISKWAKDFLWLINVNEGFEQPDGRFGDFGLSSFYFISWFLSYLFLFFLVWIPLLILLIIVKILWRKDKQSPVLNMLGLRLEIWVCWSWFMRFFQVYFLDMILVTGLNIWTYLEGNHLWSRYMEKSFVASFFFFAVLFIFFLYGLNKLKKLTVVKTGLPAHWNAASKGLNPRRKCAYLMYFIHGFGIRMFMVLLILLYDVMDNNT